MLTGEGFRFQNPLQQNLLHVRAVADLLELPHDASLPVVIFVGDSTLKSPLAEQVLSCGLLTWSNLNTGMRTTKGTKWTKFQRVEGMARSTLRAFGAIFNLP